MPFFRLDIRRDTHTRAQGQTLAINGPIFVFERKCCRVSASLLLIGQGIGRYLVYRIQHQAAALAIEGFTLHFCNLGIEIDDVLEMALQM